MTQNIKNVFYELQNQNNNIITSGSLEIDITKPIDELKRAVYNENDNKPILQQCNATHLHVYPPGTTDFSIEPESIEKTIAEVLNKPTQTTNTTTTTTTATDTKRAKKQKYIILLARPPIAITSNQAPTPFSADYQASIEQKLEYVVRLNSLVIESQLDPWRGTTERTKAVSDTLTREVLKFYNYEQSKCMMIGEIGKQTKKKLC
jgi:hypothetical protein